MSNAPHDDLRSVAGDFDADGDGAADILAAVRYAAAAPERVCALVLASPGGAPMSGSDLEGLLSTFRPGSHVQALAVVDRLFPHRRWWRAPFAWGLRQRLQRPAIRNLVDRIRSDAYSPSSSRHSASRR